jgi:hypothetical protein
MILYQLRCGADHGFEAWFRNSDAYDLLQAEKQIACPICGTAEVRKAPMAPRIGRSSRGEPEAAVPAPAAPPPVPSEGDAARLNQMKMVMSRIAELNRHITETCDYVGKSFPEEARKIHYGEAEHREIYGEASPHEAEELREEGIPVASIPWLRRNDS